MVAGDCENRHGVVIGVGGQCQRLGAIDRDGGNAHPRMQRLDDAGTCRRADVEHRNYVVWRRLARVRRVGLGASCRHGPFFVRRHINSSRRAEHAGGRSHRTQNLRAPLLLKSIVAMELGTGFGGWPASGG